TAAAETTSGKNGAPNPDTAGGAFTITVNAVDANWNVVTTAPSDNIHITTTDANDTEPSNNTLSSGTRTFSITFKTAGTATITASDVTDGSKSANTSPSITVNVGVITKLQILLPGEAAAPGSTSGKTVSPTGK